MVWYIVWWIGNGIWNKIVWFGNIVVRVYNFYLKSKLLVNNIMYYYCVIVCMFMYVCIFVMKFLVLILLMFYCRICDLFLNFCGCFDWKFCVYFGVCNCKCIGYCKVYNLDCKGEVI